MDRRSFLRGATVVGSGVIAGGAVAGCSNPSSRSANPNRGATTSTSTTTGQGPPDWATLSGSLTGTLLQPSDSGYAAAGHLYNAVYVPNAAASRPVRVSDGRPTLSRLRPRARRGGDSSLGRTQLRRLLVVSRTGHRRVASEYDFGRRSDRRLRQHGSHGRSRIQVDRRLCRPGRARPPLAGRLVPHRGNRRIGVGRRHRSVLPGLRPHVRPDRGG